MSAERWLKKQISSNEFLISGQKIEIAGLQHYHLSPYKLLLDNIILVEWYTNERIQKIQNKLMRITLRKHCRTNISSNGCLFNKKSNWMSWQWCTKYGTICSLHMYPPASNPTKDDPTYITRNIANIRLPLFRERATQRSLSITNKLNILKTPISLLNRNTKYTQVQSRISLLLSRQNTNLHMFR